MFTIQTAKNAKSGYRDFTALDCTEQEAINQANAVSINGTERVRVLNAEGEKIHLRKAEAEAEARETADDGVDLPTATVQEDEGEETGMDTTPNYRVMDYPLVDLKGMEPVDGWNTAKDVVDYPVYVYPAYGWSETDGAYYKGEGVTNTGRDTEFFLVYTDKNRLGERNAVAAMTGRFCPVATKSVYTDLQESLSAMGENARPQFVYVSGDGGHQRLMVDVENRQGMDGKITLRLVADTSVDGTKAHTLSMFAVDNATNTPIAAYGGVHKLANRHTINAIQESAYFGDAIGGIIEAWDDEIIPMLTFLNDKEFSINMAVEVAKEFAKDSGLGQRHLKRLEEETRLGNAAMSGYDIIREVSAYVENSEGNSPEWKARVHGKMENAIQRMMNRLSK